MALARSKAVTELALSCVICTLALSPSPAGSLDPTRLTRELRPPALRFMEGPAIARGVLELTDKVDQGPPWPRLLWVAGASALTVAGSFASGLPAERGFRAAGISLGLSLLGAGSLALGVEVKDAQMVFLGGLLGITGPAAGISISEHAARHEPSAHGRNAALLGALAGGAAAAFALLWRAELEHAGFLWWCACAGVTALAMASAGVLAYAISERHFVPRVARP